MMVECVVSTGLSTSLTIKQRSSATLLVVVLVIVTTAMSLEPELVYGRRRRSQRRSVRSATAFLASTARPRCASMRQPSISQLAERSSHGVPSSVALRQVGMVDVPARSVIR